MSWLRVNCERETDGVEQRDGKETMLHWQKYDFSVTFAGIVADNSSPIIHHRLIRQAVE